MLRVRTRFFEVFAIASEFPAERKVIACGTLARYTRLMLYALGLASVYEPKLATGFCLKGGPGVDKDGKRDPGGWVWQTPEEVWAYIVLRKSEATRRVYGVIAEWEIDTVSVPGEPTRCLTRDALVIRVPQPITVATAR
jgi:hypothetical protein